MTSDDPVSVCLREVACAPPLTDEEARELETMRPIPEFAKVRLIESNLPMVVEIASGFQDSGKHMLDLIQEGNIGLLRAVETFAESGAVRFSEYARASVERRIREFIGGDELG